MKTNFGVNIDDINMSDEFETEWIKKEYSYECPNNNYLDGWDSTDTIETIYIGPKTIYFLQTMKQVNLKVCLENTSYRMIQLKQMMKQL